MTEGYLGREQCWTESCAAAPPAPLWRVMVWPETSMLDTPPASSSQGWGKLGEPVGKEEPEELENTRLAWEVKEGEPWNWEVGVPPPLAVLLSSS